MMSKNQTEVEKSAVGNNFELGSYRFQEYNDDRIHVHDDGNNLLFEYIGKRNFQLVIDEFIRNNFSYSVGTKVVMRGGNSEKTARKAADLVLTKTNGGWDLNLVPIGVCGDGIVIGDRTIMTLRDFIDSF